MNEAERLTNLCERCLNEMATLTLQKKGYLFDFTIYSRDEHYPPHIHVSQDGQEICRVVIPESEPNSPEDIFFLKESKPVNDSIGFKKQILKTFLSATKRGNPVWLQAQELWDSLNPNLEIENFDYNNLQAYL